MGESQCGGMVARESCGVGGWGVGKLRCEGVTVCVSFGVEDLQFVGVALHGSCGGGVSVWGSGFVEDL